MALLSLEAYRPDNLDKLRFGWLIAFLLAAVVAWIEILTDQHLPTPRAEHNLDYFADSKIVSTLSHTSNFGGFLILVIPFLIWSMEQTKGVAKLAYITLIGAVGHLMFYTASRIGLLGLIAQLVVYVAILNRRWYAVLLLALGGIVAFGYWTHMSSHGEFAMARKLSNVYETGTDTSMDHRLALTLNGLYMLYKTAGRGVGAAGFEENISGEDLLVPLPILTIWGPVERAQLLDRDPESIRRLAVQRIRGATGLGRAAGLARAATAPAISARWSGAVCSWHWSVTCSMARQAAPPWSNPRIGCSWAASSSWPLSSTMSSGQSQPPGVNAPASTQGIASGAERRSALTAPVVDQSARHGDCWSGMRVRADFDTCAQRNH